MFDQVITADVSTEVVRGQPMFVLIGLLLNLKRHLRNAAGAGSWQVRV